jgi:epoxyqueuosine reductase
MHELAGRIKSKAREIGFDLVGIASADPSRYRDYFRQWLDDGQAGSMAYLADRFAERIDPATYLPGTQSIICLAINYYAQLAPPTAGAVGEHGRVARYALGDDYHEIIKRRLHQLADWLRREVTDVRTRCSVDTAPVMEKELAARAGVGHSVHRRVSHRGDHRAVSTRRPAVHLISHDRTSRRHFTRAEPKIRRLALRL